MKNLFCIIILSLASCIVYAGNYSINKKSGMYLGSKVYLNNDNNIFNKKYFFLEDSFLNIKSEKFLNSFFVGYKKNPYFSIEIGCNKIKYFSFNKNLNKKKYNILNFNTGIKFSYPINKKIAIYNKLGSLVKASYLIQKLKNKNLYFDKLKLFPTFSIGIEYFINNYFSTTLNYEWTKNLFDFEYQKENINFKKGCVNIGMILNLNTVKNSDLFESNYDFKFKEMILFPFGSSKLNSSSIATLKNLFFKIKNMNLLDAKFRITAYNDKLSALTSIDKKILEERIKSVFIYLLQQGISKSRIKKNDIYNKNPIVEKFCQGIKDKNILVSCLAPDRRVEIEVFSK